MFTYEPVDHLCQATLRHYPETWSIVSSSDACLLMRDMAESGRPAVDALLYLPSFVRLDEIVRHDGLVKNFHSIVGRMCKQVMEYLSYELVEEVGITSRYSPFQTGAVYQWKGS